MYITPIMVHKTRDDDHDDVKLNCLRNMALGWIGVNALSCDIIMRGKEKENMELSICLERKKVLVGA